jgi:hypothetical protein
MAAEVEQIVSKLTPQELDLLQDRFGLNLRAPEVAQAFESLETTRRRIRAIEERVLRKRREQQGERPHCSFCDGTPEQLGSLCQSPRGPYICVSCARAAVELLSPGDRA